MSQTSEPLGPFERDEQVRRDMERKRRDFNETMERNRRRDMQRLAWILCVDTTLFFAMLLGPTWLQITLVVVVVSWVVWLVACWPGRCVVCGRPTIKSTPSSSYREQPVYLWWKPRPRHMNIYACSDHIPQVMLTESVKLAAQNREAGPR